jgi:alpha-tubulin suppressor-like RCC1 family protein
MTTGYNHTCALLSTGQVRCSGDNEYGQLGNGTNDDETRAVPVRNSTNTANLGGVIQISGSGYHTCALLNTRQVKCWGFGGYGELGDGDFDNENLPVAVRNRQNTAPLGDVAQINAGYYSTCAVLRNGTAQCWGINDNGQVGDATAGTARGLPRRVVSVTAPGFLTGVRQIESGQYHTCATLTNGQARCWGYNGEGELGAGAPSVDRLRPVVVRATSGPGPLTDVRRISTGEYHACATLTNGQARCWGYNDTGAVGDGTENDRFRPTVVRTVSGPGALTGIVSVVAGSYHSCALLANGQVRCWGQNLYDQLGNGVEAGPEIFRPRAVRNTLNSANLVGARQMESTDYHTCVTLANAQARCWGWDDDGALGHGGTTQSPLPVIFST